jgi:anthraniloyl-CoA monooxygenase
VWERNAADDTFGFGVVFSDETLGGIEHADPLIYAAMEREFARWDDIDVHYRDRVVTSGGHSFAALSRKRLLQILQQRCADLLRGYTAFLATQPSWLHSLPGYTAFLATQPSWLHSLSGVVDSLFHLMLALQQA